MKGIENNMNDEELSEETICSIEAVLHPDNQREAIALARSLCPFAENASDILMLVCIAMVELKADENLICTYIGFEKSRLRGHLQSRLATRIMSELSRHRIRGVAFIKAIWALEDIVGDAGSGAKTRASAAKTLIELKEAQEDNSPEDPDGGLSLSEMTLSQIEARVNSIRKDMIHISHNTDVQDIEEA